MISFGDSDSDGYKSNGYSDDESSYLGAYITPKSIEEQIKFAKQSIINLTEGLDVEETSILPPEEIDSLIEQQMNKKSIPFSQDDTDEAKLTKLNELREKLLQEEREKKGGKRRKSKKYRKSRKQRKTKTKRRLRRSYKYKYK